MSREKDESYFAWADRITDEEEKKRAAGNSARLVVDRMLAYDLERAGNTVSGLDLSEIGEDGHAVANKLWKIAGYLRNRRAGEAPG